MLNMSGLAVGYSSRGSFKSARLHDECGYRKGADIGHGLKKKKKKEKKLGPI